MRVNREPDKKGGKGFESGNFRRQVILEATGTPRLRGEVKKTTKKHRIRRRYLHEKMVFFPNFSGESFLDASRPVHIIA